MTVAVSENVNKDLMVSFDVEGRGLYNRIVAEKAPGKTSASLLEELLTNWMAQHNDTFDLEDFKKLTAVQKKKALEEGKKIP